MEFKIKADFTAIIIVNIVIIIVINNYVIISNQFTTIINFIIIVIKATFIITIIIIAILKIDYFDFNFNSKNLSFVITIITMTRKREFIGL